MIIKIYSVLVNRYGILKQKALNALINKKKTLLHNNTSMVFFIPNPLSLYRIKTFATKEPETLDWIDSFKEDSVMWDIGANIGLYSIYAAKSKNVKVFAFEPSVFNLEFLAKNIHVNNLSTQISIMPIALSNQAGFNTFKMNNPVWGGALSSFGADFDQFGKKFNTSFEYNIPGLRADDVLEIFNIPKPDYLKIDVDGIEHLILEGLVDILHNVKNVLVEINDSFIEQKSQSEGYLEKAGLKLIAKFEIGATNMHNQLWSRK